MAELEFDRASRGPVEILGGIDADRIADGSVSNAEFQRLNGVTSDIQTQLNAKLPSASLLRAYLDTPVTYNNNDTLANTALSVTVVSGGKYDIRLVLFGTNAVRSLQLAFGGTATITAARAQWTGDELTASGPLATIEQEGTTDLTAPYSNVNLDGGDNLYLLIGSVHINAGGTFILQGAQRTADASDTQILEGSTLLLTKMN